MKKHKFILIPGILLLIFFGCKKEDISDVPEEKPAPEVVKGNAYALPDSIAYGDSATFYWESISGVTSVTINGKPAPSLSGQMPLNGLTTDTTFNVLFKGIKESDTQTTKIKVAEKPILTKLDTLLSMLCSGKRWHDVEVRDYSLDGILLNVWVSSEKIRNTAYTFLSDNYSIKIDDTANGGVIYHTEPEIWGFTQNCTKIRRGKADFDFILNDSIFITITPNSIVSATGGEDTPILTHSVFKVLK